MGPVGGRAAQRTLSNRRDGAARLGEAPPSHTWRGLVLCLPTHSARLAKTVPGPTRRLRPLRRMARQTPPGPAARGPANSVEFEGADIAGRPEWAGLAPLVGRRA